MSNLITLLGDEKEKFLRIGIAGTGDNLIRKILSSIGQVGGIRLVALTNRHKTLKECFDRLRAREDEAGNLMYSGELEKRMRELEEAEKSGSIKYFQLDENGNLSDEFLSSIDLLHISSPDAEHGKQAVQAVRKGVHIICEKPFAESYEEAVKHAKEIDEAESRGIVVSSANHYVRYGPAFALIKNWGKFNNSFPVVRVEGKFLEDESSLNTRTKELFKKHGILHDMVIHYVAILRKLNINLSNGSTLVYRYPGYDNETGASLFCSLEGKCTSSGTMFALKAGKGRKESEKYMRFIFKDGRVVILNFLKKDIGILDSFVTDYKSVWWRGIDMDREPLARVYEEAREEIIMRKSGKMNGNILYTVGDSIKDLSILDNIRTKAVVMRPHEFYEDLGKTWT